MKYFHYLLKSKHFWPVLLVMMVGWWAWYPTLNFWFLKGYEVNWLMSTSPPTLVNLIKAHSFFYYLDWKVFGWQPWGWYLTSLVFHLLATGLLYWFLVRLSKSRSLALTACLFFVAHSAYNDVLTWGSFNSYYPFLLILLLSALLNFHQLIVTHKKRFLCTTGLFIFSALLVRETAMVMVPLLTAFELLFFVSPANKSRFKSLLLHQIPLYLTVVVFLYVRSLYGGISGDSADSNVKLQTKLIAEKEYGLYLQTAALTFGKLIPPQFIPYPRLNTWRENQIKLPAENQKFKPEELQVYLFPATGGIIFALLSLVTAFVFLGFKSRQVKSKNEPQLNTILIQRLLLFSWCWLSLFSLFVALVVPNTPEVLARAYEFNTMRYRYFSFVGVAIFLATLLEFLKPKLTKFLPVLGAQMVIGGLVVTLVITQLQVIRQIEQEVYAIEYLPAKKFYQQFYSYFPQLPTNVTFYFYPLTSNLNNLMQEWSSIKDTNYPNLAGQPFRVESQVEAMLLKIKSGKLQLEESIFLDYDDKLGLINRTEEARKILTNQKDYQLSLGQDKTQPNFYHSETFDGPVVELPYSLQLKANIWLDQARVGSQPNSRIFRALVDYATDQSRFLKTATISASPTLAQRIYEPFLHVVPNNVLDGNHGRRSSWIADAIPSFVTIDLQQKNEVHAVTWGATYSTRAPANYSIFSSNDGEDWLLQKNVLGNTKLSGIETFDQPFMARYVKFVTQTTISGDSVSLDELEVITNQGRAVLAIFTNRDELIKARYDLFRYLAGVDDLRYAQRQGLDFVWAKLLWTTQVGGNGAVIADDQSSYIRLPLGAMTQPLNIKIPEAEIFAGVGQFLQKRITRISLDFGSSPIRMGNQSAQLIPRQKL